MCMLVAGKGAAFDKLCMLAQLNVIVLAMYGVIGHLINLVITLVLSI